MNFRYIVNMQKLAVFLYNNEVQSVTLFMIKY